MSPARVDTPVPESSSMVSSPPLSLPGNSIAENRRFADLRGVQWRIDLGILPSSASIDDLRRVTADSRRRYAALRRHLLVNPHAPKDGSISPDLVVDNPLSQNPDSMWGRFFQNAELEKMVDQDLSRLYPEHGSYFQTPECQVMLRRILLLWCLSHPEHGYGQGMHELLAPLLYVLHVDVENLSLVRKLYEDHFTDKFDGFAFHESNLIYNSDLKNFSESKEDETDSQNSSMKVCSLDKLDPKIQAVVLLSDAYGTEGELGIVLSEKFMEHDAYSMFDALMGGAGGAVAMAEFFSPSALGSSPTGLPPIIEASSALYYFLSIIDSSLHDHLVELGVEPQYFALRWLRVLFGREFTLEDLLIVWDEIFASDSHKSISSAEDDAWLSFRVLSSPRGAFISSIAISMILYLRCSLLASENATSCLQRLLNFPANINLKKLMMKAKSLQALALDASNSITLPTCREAHSQSKSVVVRGHYLSLDSISPRTPLSLVAESYWEEQWRVLHRAEELNQGSVEKQVPNRRKGWSEKMRLRLTRTESAPPPSKVDGGKKQPVLSSGRSLLEDLSQQLRSEGNTEKILCNEGLGQKHPVNVEVDRQDGTGRRFTCRAERSLSGNAGSKANFSIFSDPPSPRSGANDHESESERNSIASNLAVNGKDVEPDNAESHRTDPESSPFPVPDCPEEISLKSGQNDNSMGKSATGLKERKLLSGKFHWFWKYRRNSSEGMSDKGGPLEATKASCGASIQNIAGSSSLADESNSSSVISKGDAVDQNVMVTLRNLGQSMLENIQVIESVFQQDSGQVGSLENLSNNVIAGGGQVTATAALKELRKISDILSEM